MDGGWTPPSDAVATEEPQGWTPPADAAVAEPEDISGVTVPSDDIPTKSFSPSEIPMNVDKRDYYNPLANEIGHQKYSPLQRSVILKTADRFEKPGPFKYFEDGVNKSRDTYFESLGKSGAVKPEDLELIKSGVSEELQHRRSTIKQIASAPIEAVKGGVESLKNIGGMYPTGLVNAEVKAKPSEGEAEIVANAVAKPIKDLTHAAFGLAGATPAGSHIYTVAKALEEYGGENGENINKALMSFVTTATGVTPESPEWKQTLALAGDAAVAVMFGLAIKGVKGDISTSKSLDKTVANEGVFQQFNIKQGMRDWGIIEEQLKDKSPEQLQELADAVQTPQIIPDIIKKQELESDIAKDPDGFATPALKEEAAKTTEAIDVEKQRISDEHATEDAIGATEDLLNQTKEKLIVSKEGKSQSAQELIDRQIAEIDKELKPPIEKPSVEQIYDDVNNGRIVTFEYKTESEVPDIFKEKITSKGEINGKPYVKVSISKSEADYYLKDQELKSQPPTQSPILAEEAGSAIKEDGVAPEIKEGELIEVHHGSGSDFKLSDTKEPQIYLTENKSEAAEYAKIHSGDVYSYLLDKNKIATEEQVRETIKKLGLKDNYGELVDGEQYLIHELIDQRFEDTAISPEDVVKLYKELQTNGYDAIRFMDQGLNDGGLTESVVVFNTKGLKDKINKSTPPPSPEPIKPIENEKTTPSEEGVLETPAEPPPSEPKPSPEDTGNYKERRFAQQVLKDPKISKHVKEGLAEDAINYVPKENIRQQADALAIIEIKGEQAALDMIKDETNGMQPDSRVFIAQNLIRRFNKDKNFTKAVETADHISKYLTELGRGVQAASIFGELTPEGQIIRIGREIKQQRETALERDKPKINRLKKQINKATTEAVKETFESPEVKKAMGEATKAVKSKSNISPEKAARISELRKKFLPRFNDITEIPALLFDKEFIEYGKLIIEEGAADFKAFSKQLVKDFGEKVRPILRDLYLKSGGVEDAKGAEIRLKEAAKSVTPEGTSFNKMIRDIVREHYTVAENAKTTLIDKILENEHLKDVPELDKLIKTIESTFDKIIKDKKEKIIEAEKKRMSNKISGTKKKAQRDSLYEEIMKQSNLGSLSDEKFNELWAEKMELPKLTEENIKEITRLSEKIQSTPEGFQRDNAIQDLLTYQAKMKGMNPFDVAMSVWYANILSGPTTQMVNVIANTLNTAHELGVATAKNPKSLPTLVNGLWNGWGRGLLEAKSVLKTGYSKTREKIETPNVLEQWNFKGGKFNPANYYKYVRRVMEAADMFSYEGLQEMRAYELARKEAIKEGTPTKEAWKKATEKLFNTPERLAEAREEAAASFKPGSLDYKRRVLEIMELSRPQEMIEDSHAFALRGTFNYRPEGTIGVLTESVTNALNVVKPLKFIVPFTRVIANVANNALDYTPVGYWRAYKGGIGHSFYENVIGGKNKYRKLTPEQRVDATVKATAGVVAMASFYAMSEPDENGKSMIEITANGTSDYEKNNELKNTGWQPYSVKVGNKWYSYQYTPLAIPLAIIGNVRDAEKYKKEDYDSILQRFGMSVFNGFKFMTDMTFLSSASDAFAALAGTTDQGVKFFENLVTKTAKGFIVPNLYSQGAKEVQEIFDMPQKQADTFTASMYKDIPVAMNSLNDVVNSLGEPVIPDNDRFVSKVKSEPIWEFITKNEAWIKKPKQGSIIITDPKTNIERGLTDDEYYDFMKLSGSKIKSEVENIMGDKLSKSEVQEQVSEIKERARKEAKWELFGIGKAPKAILDADSQSEPVDVTEQEPVDVTQPD